MFCSLADSCSTYRLTQEGGIYMEKHSTSWMVESFFALFISVAVLFVLYRDQHHITSLVRMEKKYFSYQTLRLVLVPTGNKHIYTGHFGGRRRVRSSFVIIQHKNAVSRTTQKLGFLLHEKQKKFFSER